VTPQSVLWWRRTGEQAPRSRQPCSTCRRRGGRLRCARFVSVTNGCESVTEKRTAVKLVDLGLKPNARHVGVRWLVLVR